MPGQEIKQCDDLIQEYKQVAILENMKNSVSYSRR